MAIGEQDRTASPDAPRDPALDRVYAAGAREEPPARLDAAIRAAARREVRAGPRRPDSVLRAWRAPVALAAVLVLSVTVVLLLREEGADRLTESPPRAAAPSSSADRARPDDNAPPVQSATPSPKPEPAPRAATPGEAVSRFRAAPEPQAAPAEDDRSRKEQAPAAEPKQESPQPLKTQRPAPQPFAEPPAASAELRRAAPAAAPSQAGNLAKEMESGATAGARVMEQAAPAPSAPSPPAMVEAPDAASRVPANKAAKAPADAAAPKPVLRAERQRGDDVSAATAGPVWQGLEREAPEKWLERVAELRRGGRDAEAREILAEFRRRFPQHPVPAGLDR